MMPCLGNGFRNGERRPLPHPLRIGGVAPGRFSIRLVVERQRLDIPELCYLRGGTLGLL